jgi:hypothetical protein
MTTEQLSELHGRSTRKPPESRNKPRAEPVLLAAPEQPALVPAPPPAPVIAKPELKVVTIYLDDDDDDLLEGTTHIGRTTRPKVAISRSAIIRYALKELYARKTHEQIVEELRPRGGPYGVGIGRKRR